MGKDVQVEWMPFELRPYPNETLRPEGDYLQRAWEESVLPAARSFGLEMVLPKVSPQPHTQLAFEGYQYARENGKGNEYNHRVFQAFFQEGQDIATIDVLVKLADGLGLDEQEFRNAIESRKYSEVHQKALHHAYNEVRVKAVPTFVIGNRVLTGLHDKDVLEEVINEQLQNKV